MNRREVMAMFGTAAAALGAASTAIAEDEKKHGAHHDHEQCAKECSDCSRECNACQSHCMGMLADGKKEHLASARMCLDCADICRACAGICSRSGPLMKGMLQNCAEACEKCAAVCEECCKKGSHDDIMMRCAEACRRCAKACHAELAKVS